MFWVLVALAVVALPAGVVLQWSSAHVYDNRSAAMEPTLMPGDHLQVVKGSSVRRGDVIILFRAGTPAPLVSRVIGRPGDRVTCCTSQGRVTVNGKPLDETYISRTGPPSERRFSVTLGHAQYWVMGDNRNVALDSRTWGPLPVSEVIGRVAATGLIAPATTLSTPQTFVADGLAPKDQRAAPGGDGLAVVGFGVIALVVLAVFGTIRFLVRRSRRRRPPPYQAAWPPR